LVIVFELEGQRFMAMNGGPQFKFTEAIFLMVSCDTQSEVDDFWEKLSAGGAKRRRGWLKDKFGLSWQVVPSVLGTMMADTDAERLIRVLSALTGMTKLDIAELQRAYDGGKP
jgi:predicted 3-demethylubiquinone-9 3-methyltransferase (glyoxalase superfamily)